MDESKANLDWVCKFLNVAPIGDGKAISGLCSTTHPKTDALAFVQSDKKIDLESLKVCAAVITTAQIADKLPSDTVGIVSAAPQIAFASVARALFSGRKPAHSAQYEHVDGSQIAKSALIEENVTIEPGCVIGPNVAIGSGSYIAANSTIEANCQIGRDCSIGPNATVQYALIGNNVCLHAGARIGQDGFGFVPGKSGLEKVPQLGRVIIQDHVEIGANTTIDRGTLDDTIIGENTKIDNLVQIGHNVVIGRSTAIAGFAGISGSATIGDGCLIGGRVGIADHINIGNGVQLAATSSVMNDIPDGEKWAGTPAQPIRAFFREQATLRRLAKPNKTAS